MIDKGTVHVMFAGLGTGMFTSFSGPSPEMAAKIENAFYTLVVTLLVAGINALNARRFHRRALQEQQDAAAAIAAPAKRPRRKQVKRGA